MKLCRFALKSEPENIRAGVLHDQRVYETDGQMPEGVHELADIILLSPLGRAPSLRLFDQRVSPEVGAGLHYYYQNPALVFGPGAEISLPQAVNELDFEARIVTTTTADARDLQPDEAGEFCLGFSILIVMTSPALIHEERAFGAPSGASRDIGMCLGPFLVTPEELTDLLVEEAVARFAWNYRFDVNGEEVFRHAETEAPSFGELLSLSSQISPLYSSELIAAPALAKPALSETKLGRGLMAGDRLAVTIQGLGTLGVRIN